jgi:PAS domain-containing protein
MDRSATETVESLGQRKALFDAIPCPALVVDADVRVVDFNRAAAGMVGANKEFQYLRRGGEVLHCIHAEEAPDGCGTAESCQDCVLRNAVTAAVAAGTICRRRARMEVRTSEGKSTVLLMVTASPISDCDEPRILVLFEDVADVMQLEKILPICSYCKKIRNSTEYWESVEAYFLGHAGVMFSHSICESCMKREHGDVRL